MVVPGKRITLRDIADEACVSKTIVSKIVNGSPDVKVGREKRSRIEELVRKYDYVPLGAARSLATNKSFCISFLLSGNTTMTFANEVFAMMFCGTLDVCRQRSYRCEADVCDFLRINDFALPENMRARRIDGCVLTGGGMNEKMFNEIAKLRIPCVALGCESIRHCIPVITIDSFRCYDEILNYCTENGHHKIWYLECLPVAYDYMKAQRKLHPDTDVEVLYNYEVKEGEESAVYWAGEYAKLSPAKRPSLIISNAPQCYHLGHEMKKRGFRCPDDFSMIGTSETETARWYNPPLTTFSQNYYEIGRMGAQLLLDMLDKGIPGEDAIAAANAQTIPFTRTLRDSVRNLNA